jgi:predicted alpha/beta-hydrolase family hydrolase
MTEANWKIPVGSDTTSAVYESATANEIEGAVFVCAHGAGGSMMDRGTLALANVLRARGVGVVRFNFLYKEKKSSRPDPMPKLEATIEAVVEKVRSELTPKTLLIGGRSMGGRAASMMAARKFECDGLMLYAYPLHPAGRPEKLRDAHLPSIEVPVLCVNGTRDPLCTPDLMEAALKTVKTDWTMHWIPGADHSFHVLKSSGRTDKEVMEEIGDVSREFVFQMPPLKSNQH